MIRFASLGQCAERFASDIALCLSNAIEQRGHASLAVSGGRTPEHLFKALAAMDLAWSHVTVTLVDERWVAPDHPDSNEGLARRTLLQGAAAQARFIGMKTDSAHPLDSQVTVEQSLDKLAWPLDVVFLGMGEDGHIASLFPDMDDWQDAPGRVLAVAGSDKRQPRMSLSPKAILDSRDIFLVLTGPQKLATFEAAKKPGSIDQYPVRLVLQQNKVPLTVYAVA